MATSISSPWMALAPGLAMMLTVLAFNFLGDAIRDALDPQLGERHAMGDDPDDRRWTVDRSSITALGGHQGANDGASQDCEGRPMTDQREPTRPDDAARQRPEPSDTPRVPARLGRGRQRRAAGGLQPAAGRRPGQARRGRRSRPKRRKPAAPAATRTCSGHPSPQAGAGKPAGAAPPTAAACRQDRRRQAWRPTPRRDVPDNPRSLHSQVGGEVLVANTIYDALITLDDQLNPKPGLVESWDTPDEKTLDPASSEGREIPRRHGLRRRGRQVQHRRHQDPVTASPFSSDVDPIEAVEIVDANTSASSSAAACSPLLAAFAIQPGHMVSPTARKKYGKDFGRNPGRGRTVPVRGVGREGPHRPETVPRLLEQGCCPARRGDLPDRAGPGRAAHQPEGRRARVHPDLSFKDIPALRNNKDVQLMRTWAGADRFIFNNSKPPFDKKPLRQALQLAYDREALHQSVFFETGVIGYGPVHPPGSWAFDPNWKPFPKPDLDAARAKLKEGGHPDGFEFDVDVSDAINRQLAEAYQAMYQPLGIKVTIDMMDGAKQLRRATSLEYVSASRPGRRRPTRVRPFITPYHSKGTTNYLKYSNPKVDELLDKARCWPTTRTSAGRSTVRWTRSWPTTRRAPSRTTEPASTRRRRRSKASGKPSLTRMLTCAASGSAAERHDLMGRYLLQRLVGMLLMLAIISVVSYSMVRLLPGDPVIAIFGDGGDPAVMAAVRADLGLDQPAAHTTSSGSAGSCAAISAARSSRTSRSSRRCGRSLSRRSS